MFQTNGESDLMIFTRNGQGIRFVQDEVRPTGRASQGVRGIRLRAGDSVVGAAIAAAADDVLFLTEGGFGKRTRLSDFPVKHRGGLGVKAIKIVSTRGSLATARAVVENGRSCDYVIRRNCHPPNRWEKSTDTGETPWGVKVMNLAEGAALSAVAIAIAVPVEVDDDE